MKKIILILLSAIALVSCDENIPNKKVLESLKSDVMVGVKSDFLMEVFAEDANDIIDRIDEVIADYGTKYSTWMNFDYLDDVLSAYEKALGDDYISPFNNAEKRIDRFGWNVFKNELKTTVIDPIQNGSTDEINFIGLTISPQNLGNWSSALTEDDFYPTENIIRTKQGPLLWPTFREIDDFKNNINYILCCRLYYSMNVIDRIFKEKNLHGNIEYTVRIDKNIFEVGYDFNEAARYNIKTQTYECCDYNDEYEGLGYSD